MAEFVLACQVKPPSGETCPPGQDEWVTASTVQYEALRDVFFQPPFGSDVNVIMPVVVTISVLLNLPNFLGGLVRGMMKSAGIS